MSDLSLVKPHHITVPCFNHPDHQAVYQLTLYTRTPIVALVWRGMVCADCFISSRDLIKKNGPTHIFLIWPITR